MLLNVPELMIRRSQYRNLTHKDNYMICRTYELFLDRLTNYHYQVIELCDGCYLE